MTGGASAVMHAVEGHKAAPPPSNPPAAQLSPDMLRALGAAKAAGLTASIRAAAPDTPGQPRVPQPVAWQAARDAGVGR